MVSIEDIDRMWNIGDVDGLIRCLNDTDGWVRGYAAIALGRLGDRRAFDALMNCLNNSDVAVRGRAAYALGLLGDKRAFDALMRCLSDSVEEVRVNAAFALGLLGDKRAIPALEKMLYDNSKAYVLGTTGKEWRKTTVSAVAKEAIDKIKPLKQREHNHAQGLERALNFAGAIKIYEKYGMADDIVRVKRLWASALAEQGNYIEAAEKLEEIGDYDNAGEMRRRGIKPPVAPIAPKIMEEEKKAIEKTIIWDEGKQLEYSKGEITLYTKYEFHRGEVRMKYSVVNNSETVITDVRIEPIYDENVYRIDHSYPYKLHEGKVIINEISASEAKSCYIYLDPQICGFSDIEGIVSYKDAKGKRHTIDIEKKTVKIICKSPILPGEASTAEIKNYIENELTVMESKVYELAMNKENAEKVYELCKEVICGYKFKRCRAKELRDERTIEDWFFGTHDTGLQKLPFIICCRILIDKGAYELSVATYGQGDATAWLAELGRNVKKRIKEEGIGVPRVLNIDMKESVIGRMHLLSQEGSVDFYARDSVIGRIEK